jgi:catechol 2,3-dioxygenase-like lactoylglutathione lyase family enzyme
METVGIHHVALNVHDLDEALRFYVDQLGFGLLERPDFGFRGAWLEAGASQIHLMEDPRRTIDTRQHVALQVRGLPDIVTALEAAGVDASVAPYVPGAGRQAFLHDPSGNRIELNEPDGAR